jgi:hypothetical protein
VGVEWIGELAAQEGLVPGPLTTSPSREYHQGYRSHLPNLGGT